MWKISRATVGKITQAISSRYPIIYLTAWEEERIEQILVATSRMYYEDRPLMVWTATRGFYAHQNRASGADGDEVAEPRTTDPVRAIESIAARAEDAIFLMKDLPAHFENNNELVRAIRDLYSEISDRNTLVVLSHPITRVPEVLKKEMFLLELGLPDEQEITGYIEHVLASRDAASGLTDAWASQCATAMHGLTLNEVRHLALRITSEQKTGAEEALTYVLEEKAQVLLKESCLRVVSSRPSMSSVGGLENLKKWVETRRKLFSKEAHDAGVAAPSGVLFTGVSGCGKSLAAKAISSAWGLQLVRLDMNLVLSGAYGSPEYAFDHACQVAESISPLVLWIDEIENAFGYDESAAGRGNVNIFSSFLTWMQEKPAAVFVAATANRIHKLPAEMIRKGRFDQLFFIDLPDEKERGEIFRVHIRKNGGDPEYFDIGILTAITKGRTGSEIEQAVKAARIDAFVENRNFTQRDISRNSSQMVPLSVTMNEQIKELRRWSNNRAAPASKQARDGQGIAS